MRDDFDRVLFLDREPPWWVAVLYGLACGFVIGLALFAAGALRAALWR